MSRSDPRTPIQALAQKCANAGLRLRDARTLFDALYIADALAQTGGVKSRAATIAGVQREALSRLSRPKPDLEPWPEAAAPDDGGL